MDSKEVKEIWTVYKRLKKSSILAESLLGWSAKHMLKKWALKKGVQGLSFPSSTEGSKIAKDVVQSFLLPIDTWEMRETNLELYRFRAFE